MRGVETAQHLFLTCPVFAPLWSLIRTWVDIFSVDPFLLQDHFVQFTHSAGGPRARRSFLQLLWLCCIWVVWHERNSRIFKAKKSTVHQMLDKIKAHSLWLMKAFN
ncbi:kinesin-like protein, partial [Trifolium medium]|nr:kinesin-like protein [Trifolium medium]